MVILLIFLFAWVMLHTVVSLAQQKLINELRQTLRHKPWITEPRATPIDSSDKFKCGCDHHFAYHDRRNGKCKHADHVTRYDRDRDRSAYLGTQHCRCQGYTGTIPPVVKELKQDDDVVIPLADGTQLSFPRGWTDAHDTEVVRWNPSR